MESSTTTASGFEVSLSRKPAFARIFYTEFAARLDGSFGLCLQYPVIM